ncbi:hypothetical protein E8E14_012124 [Neopestalotiopsis sp. 37M]|nr:hypothetical protein E8E14_012124 [Neopestalotiopsis sp. 37M]
MGLPRELKCWAKGIFRRSRKEQQRQASQTGHTSDTRVASSFKSASSKSDRDGNRRSKDESPHQNRSLWDRAYEALRVSDPKLVAEYETLLNKEIRAMDFALTGRALNHNTISEGKALNSRGNFSRFDLEYMLKTASARLEEQKLKISMGSHELVVEEGVAKAANFALWVKDLVGKAVEASPQASFAWAGVCLVLPLLTNPETAKEAQRDGFAYATERMHYYTALEPIIRRLDEDPEENNALARIENSIEKLYQYILEFQVKIVLRLYQGSLGRYWQDIISSASWTEMKKRIQDLSSTVDGELSLIHGLVADSELKSLNKTSQQSFKNLQMLELISQQQLDTTQDLLSLQKDAADRALSEKEERVKHLFLRSTGRKKATYEWYKSRVEDSVQGTCQWFLSQEGYTKWLAQESGTLLVTADPGCGKSVLSKHLIDHQLQPTTVYFFFKDQDQNTVCQALCALLHQLFVQKPFLIKYAMDEHSNSGEDMVNSTVSLWRVFDNIVRDPRAGSVTIVLDALDECAEPELKDLTKGLIQHFKIGSPGEPQSDCKLKVLLTSRPYKTIVTQLQKLLNDFTSVRIPGEQYSEAIGEEVNLVIRKRVEQLQLTEKLQEPEKLRLKQRFMERLCDVPNRTYLWVHLVFEQLENEGLDHETEKGVDSFFEMPPRDLSETYTRILQKCTDPKKTRKAFAIMLAAQRPLKISEFNVAMNLQSDQQDFEDLDLEPNEVFASKLPSWCGLLISIHYEKVYFLHQTAREFLLESSSTGPGFLFEDSSPIKARPDQDWHHSISSRYAHTVLAEQCVFYLKLWKITDPSYDKEILLDYANIDSMRPIKFCVTEEASDDKSSLVEYASVNWVHHVKEADLDQKASLIPIVIDICQPYSLSFFMWRYHYCDRGGLPSHCAEWPLICIASYCGLKAVVEKLWTTGKAEIESKCFFNRTPLHHAAESGEVAMVQWLLETDKVDVNSQTDAGYTPLMAAASHSSPAVLKLLLETGKVDVNLKNHHDETSLIIATNHGDEAIVRLLLETGKVDVNSQDRNGYTPLFAAASYSSPAVLKLLLETGQVNINSTNHHGETSLIVATKKGNEAMVRLLLETHQADMNIKNNDGLTALDIANKYGLQAIAELLEIYE